MLREVLVLDFQTSLVYIINSFETFEDERKPLDNRISILFSFTFSVKLRTLYFRFISSLIFSSSVVSLSVKFDSDGLIESRSTV